MISWGLKNSLWQVRFGAPVQEVCKNKGQRAKKIPFAKRISLRKIAGELNNCKQVA
jgi:hypothetical protein